jgi:hypothetical protein
MFSQVGQARLRKEGRVSEPIFLIGHARSPTRVALPPLFFRSRKKETYIAHPLKITVSQALSYLLNSAVFGHCNSIHYFKNIVISGKPMHNLIDSIIDLISIPDTNICIIR